MFGAILGSAAGALGGIFGGISKNKTLRKQMSMSAKTKTGMTAGIMRTLRSVQMRSAY